MITRSFTSFVRGGPTTLTTFFLVDEIEIPLHHRNASETPFLIAIHWRVDDGPTLNADLVAL